MLLEVFSNLSNSMTLQQTFLFAHQSRLTAPMSCPAPQAGTQ